MADGEIACSKCKEPMQRGFVLDTDGKPGVLAVEFGCAGQWVEGPIEYGVFGGLKFRSKRRAPITAYRCPSCGLLELYAE
jgi:hypothetical protein